MKGFLRYHTVDKFSMLDAVVLVVSSRLVSSERYAEALVFCIVGIFVSAVITVLVERIP